jgi:hypothetical protein
MKRITSTRSSRLVLTGAVGLAGLGLGATLGPIAASATSTTTQAVTGRVTDIKNALTGLVEDGTLTQAQADKVATTLDQKLPQGGPGGFRAPGGLGRGGFGHGPGLDAAAELLKMTEADLHRALESGKTLAEVAQSKGVSQAKLIDTLVDAQKAELADAVKAGRLTQAQADAITAGLKARITALVTGPWTGHGPGRPGRHGRDRLGPDAAPGQPAPGSPTAPDTTAPGTTAPGTTAPGTTS